jgi:hypothetical protein
MKLKIKKNNIKDAVINGVKKSFEEMAFIDVIYVREEKVKVNFKHILYVNILEPIFGKIAMYLSYDCKRMILENIYSKVLSELHTDEIDDCQLELLNILVGNILSYYYQKKKKYTLDLPKIVFDENELKWSKNVKEFYFNAEGCFLKLLVDLKD